MNVAVNCIDRHVDSGKGDRVAIHWVGEPGETRDITYRQLQEEVCKAANYFTDAGLRAGDRVAILLPIIPEAIVAMLACARLGVIHVVVFSGSSAAALRSQVDDAQAKMVITADGQYRRGTPTRLKCTADDALAGAGGPPCESVEKVVVVRRTGHDPDVDWVHGRDVWWHDTVGTASARHEAQPFDSEHPLFLLYTAGTDGRPSGVVHSSGGYLTQARYTFHYVFDHKEDRDVFWCGADIGCIAGHSYLVYGPLSDGATSVIYEGAADFPNRDRHFQIIEDYGVTTYYVTPALIRTFMTWGREGPDSHDLSSLRLLGTLGRTSPESWQWFRNVIGSNRCPVVESWFQIETGAIVIAPLPGVSAVKPGSPVSPLPGISAHIFDGDGDLAEPGEQGSLVLDRPWPAMVRGIWGDDERFVQTYWSRFGERGWYCTGVDARYDDEDAIWVLNRGGDVMTIAGHHISTVEVESALIGHTGVAEAAVFGAPDEATGQGIVAFVSLRGGADDALIADLRSRVATMISPMAEPRDIHLMASLPKTRSGKIMRYLLSDVVEDRKHGDALTAELGPGQQLKRRQRRTACGETRNSESTSSLQDTDRRTN